MDEQLKQTFFEELQSAKTLTDLSSIRVKYLGKKGIITAELKSLSSISAVERSIVGKKINELKKFIEESLNSKEAYLKNDELQARLIGESIDISLPGKFMQCGRIHPVNRVLSEIVDIFMAMGFSVEEGPEIETDYYNFEALNIPKNHPARDMQDTFYINDDIVLRTHTSPVQARVMENNKPPLRFIAPGKVYRCDADVTHTPMFHQVEGLMVDKDITFSNLKAVLETFVHMMFGHSTRIRFRPSFFPFTEPSAEIDIGCMMCGGGGCNICKGSGWVEILGAGMVNPKVFEYARYEPDEYSGFAFGMGVERITMLKYGIDDLRLFFENDVRFLKQ